jgi:hypothetical protein
MFSPADKTKSLFYKQLTNPDNIVKTVFFSRKKSKAKKTPSKADAVEYRITQKKTWKRKYLEVGVLVIFI